MPETRQRPDIMFKYKGEQHAIEYQCSPLATKYIERHNLYQAGGIRDWWILGTENYLNYKNKKDNRFRRIEDDTKIYYDSQNDILIYTDECKLNEQIIPYFGSDVHDAYARTSEWGFGKFIDKDHLNCTRLEYLVFDGCFCVSETTSSKLIHYYSTIKQKIAEASNLISEILCGEIITDKIEWVGNKDDIISFSKLIGEASLSTSSSSQLGDSITFEIEHRRYMWSSSFVLVFRIGTKFSMIENTDYDDFVACITSELKSEIQAFIKREIEYEERKKEWDRRYKEYEQKKAEMALEKERQKRERENREQACVDVMRTVCSEYVNTPVCLLYQDRHSSYRDIRFLFLRDFVDNDDFYTRILPNKLKFLKSKGAKGFTFMLPHGSNIKGFQNKLIKAGFNILSYMNMVWKLNKEGD